ncbi:unnamed protein product, partial [Rotaria sp. Silwood2]
SAKLTKHVSPLTKPPNNISPSKKRRHSPEGPISSRLKRNIKPVIQLGRSSGILLHITSLPSPYGIGDLGPEAFKFIDFLVETKQKLWQILPIYQTNSPSPYSGMK